MGYQHKLTLEPKPSDHGNCILLEIRESNATGPHALDITRYRLTIDTAEALAGMLDDALDEAANRRTRRETK